MGTYESLYRASTFVRNNIRKGDVMIRKGDVMKGDVMI
jgi:hypothetical protein